MVLASSLTFVDNTFLILYVALGFIGELNVWRHIVCFVVLILRHLDAIQLFARARRQGSVAIALFLLFSFSPYALILFLPWSWVLTVHLHVSLKMKLLSQTNVARRQLAVLAHDFVSEVGVDLPWFFALRLRSVEEVLGRIDFRQLEYLALQASPREL